MFFDCSKGLNHGLCKSICYYIIFWQKRTETSFEIILWMFKKDCTSNNSKVYLIFFTKCALNLFFSFLKFFSSFIKSNCLLQKMNFARNCLQPFCIHLILPRRCYKIFWKHHTHKIMCLCSYQIIISLLKYTWAGINVESIARKVPKGNITKALSYQITFIIW